MPHFVTERPAVFEGGAAVTHAPLDQPAPAAISVSGWTVGLALALATPASGASAQTVQAPVMGTMRATDVGMEPAMRLTSATYAARAAQIDAYESAATGVALVRSRSPAVRALAARLNEDHARLRRDRGVEPAAAQSDLPAMVDSLRRAPPGALDRLFLAQQLLVHRRAWALHSGYAADGSDPRLRAAAARAVQLEEAHLHRLPMKPMRY